MIKTTKKRKIMLVLGLLLTAVAALLFGLAFVRESFVSWAALSVAVLVCAGFFTAYDRQDISSGEVAIIAVLTALSVTGRVLFAAIPGFKPCTAIIIIAGIYFGRQQGFTVGALTALISNIYYGQGMWTPFQMTVWGLTGFFSGIFSKALQKSKPLLIIFGIISGVAFSLIMDLWSCLWADKTVILSRYLTLITTSAPFTLTYALSNTVFLLLFNKPARRIFTRIKKKFFI